MVGLFDGLLNRYISRLRLRGDGLLWFGILRLRILRLLRFSLPFLFALLFLLQRFGLEGDPG